MRSACVYLLRRRRDTDNDGPSPSATTQPLSPGPSYAVALRFPKDCGAPATARAPLHPSWASPYGAAGPHAKTNLLMLEVTVGGVGGVKVVDCWTVSVFEVKVEPPLH